MFELQGYASQLEKTNYFGAGHPATSTPAIILTGNFHIDSGQFSLARITTNNHNLYIEAPGRARGLYLRVLDTDPYVKQDNFKRQTKDQHPNIVKIFEMLYDRGEEAVDAFSLFWAVVKAGNGSMTKVQARDSFNSAISANLEIERPDGSSLFAGDIMINPEAFLAKLQASLNGFTWAQVRDFIQGTTTGMLWGDYDYVTEELE